MEITFNEIKIKEVISTQNGKRLGRATDIVFSKEENKVLGLIVPGEAKFLRKTSDIFIPIENIEKIGDDVILVKFLSGPEIKGNTKHIDKTDAQPSKSYVRFKKAKIK